MSLMQNGKYNVLIKKITRAQFDLIKLFPVLWVVIYTAYFIYTIQFRLFSVINGALRPNICNFTDQSQPSKHKQPIRVQSKGK